MTKTGAFLRRAGILRYDFLFAWRQLALLFAVCTCYDALHLLSVLHVGPKSWPNGAGMLLVLYCGAAERSSVGQVAISVPVAWLIGRIILPAWLGVFLSRPEAKSSLQTLTRSPDTGAWWASKLLTGGLAACVRLASSFAACLVMSGIGSSAAFSQELLATTYGPAASLPDCSGIATLMCLELGLYLAGVALYGALYLMVGPFWAFTALFAHALASAIAPGTLWVGDWSMLVRCGWFTPGSIDPAIAAMGCLCACLICSVAQVVALRRADIMPRRHP